MPIVFLLRAMIDKAVNRLVRDHAVSTFNLQVARDLLGRPALFKPLVHIMAQPTIARELEACVPAPASLGQLMRTCRFIACAPCLGRFAIARELTTDRARGTAQSSGNAA